MINDRLKSRRNFLRGAGVALALPWMESLPLLRAATTNQPPLRFACIYFSNGVDPAHWSAKGEGAAMEFGQAALPLTAIREDLVFLRGLYHQTAPLDSGSQARMARASPGRIPVSRCS